MKKVITLILTVVMVFSCLTAFAGCGNNEKNTADSTVIKIGGIGPLTGSYANYGTSVKKGAEIAVDEINKAGGVNGYTFELTFLDSEADSDKAVAAYGKLLDGGMQISLGATFSGPTASVVAANDENGLLLLTPSASAKASIEGSDCAFRVCFNDPSQGAVSARFVAENKLATKVAILYQSDLDYSTGLVETFKETASEVNLEIVKEVYFQTGAVDYSSQIDSIVASGADFVFLPIYAADAAIFLTQAKENAALDNVVYFGCDGLDGILGQLDEHPEYAENVMMLTPFSADAEDELVQNFVTSYKQIHNEIPDQFAADGYDAIYVIAEAIKEAEIKSGNELSKDEFNQALISAMTKITVTGVTGTMTWTADGETTKDAKAMIIKDGVATLYKGE